MIHDFDSSPTPERAPGEPALIGSRAGAPVVLTCEHASPFIPTELDGLGVGPHRRGDHIAWDIGAAEVTSELARLLSAPAILSGASRLLVDCNRRLDDEDLIVERSDGTEVRGNRGLSDEQRELRIARYYRPFHEAVDAVLAAYPDALLLSVHSFTPTLRDERRAFDAGVLFDAWEEEARAFGDALASSGLTTRYNEPYSGFEGLIYSAHEHGRRHGRRYLEIEINQSRIERAADARSVAGQVAVSLQSILA